MKLIYNRVPQGDHINTPWTLSLLFLWYDVTGVSFSASSVISPTSPLVAILVSFLTQTQTHLRRVNHGGGTVSIRLDCGNAYGTFS